MGEKKGKALALELIDDLLNENVDDSREGQKDEEPISIESSEDDKTTPELVAEPEKPAASAENVDASRTIRLSESKVVPPTTSPTPVAETDDKAARASVGRFAALRSSGAPTSTEAALAQSESLRIAQSRILELEQEIERLRQQNEELAAAGETLRRRADELMAENQKREQDYETAVSRFEQEKEILLNSKEALQRDVEDLRRKNEELELRISTNIQKIRVRERELENRLELVRMESAALIRNKDEMILELKRQIDQLNIELNNYRNKNQELNRLTMDKQEILRRTVKALRLALSMLEGEEDNAKPQRKAK